MLFRTKKSSEKIDVREGYDRWAAHYANERNPIKAASDDAIKKMLPDLHGKSVVDAGCGSGFFCAYAEQAGAAQITGIDFSGRMIDQAKLHCKTTRFMIADLQEADLGGLRADVVICALVLGHVEKIEPVVARFSQTLIKGGTFIISDFHPFLSLKGQKRTFPLDGKNYEVPHFVHMLHDYINLLTRHDFTVESMEEPMWQNEPVIFAIKARKIN